MATAKERFDKLVESNLLETPGDFVRVLCAVEDDELGELVFKAFVGKFRNVFDTRLAKHLIFNSKRFRVCELAFEAKRASFGDQDFVDIVLCEAKHDSRKPIVKSDSIIHSAVVCLAGKDKTGNFHASDKCLFDVFEYCCHDSLKALVFDVLIQRIRSELMIDIEVLIRALGTLIRDTHYFIGARNFNLFNEAGIIIQIILNLDPSEEHLRTIFEFYKAIKSREFKCNYCERLNVDKMMLARIVEIVENLALELVGRSVIESRTLAMIVSCSDNYFTRVIAWEKLRDNYTAEDLLSVITADSAEGEWCEQAFRMLVEMNIPDIAHKMNYILLHCNVESILSKAREALVSDPYIFAGQAFMNDSCFVHELKVGIQGKDNRAREIIEGEFSAEPEKTDESVADEAVVETEAEAKNEVIADRDYGNDASEA